MTPNTPAEIAREIVAEMEGIYDHAAGMSLSARPNFLWLQGRITAAVQAAERRAVERCAQAVENMASQRLLVCPRHDVSFPVFERQADILLDAANMLRALLAPDGEEAGR